MLELAAAGLDNAHLGGAHHFELEPLLAGHRLQDGGDLLERLRDRHLLGVEVHLSRFDLRQVEDVVDEAKQMLTAAVDVAQELGPLTGSQVHGDVQQDLAESHDGVERRA